MKYLSIALMLLVHLSCSKSIDDGLVAYYSFNGDTKDHSGNQNHAVNDGADLINDRFGQPNRAYHFDGERSMMLANVKNMPPVNSPQSFSWWYQTREEPSFLDELGADNMIALVDTTENIGIQFGFRAPGYQSLGYDSWNWGGGTLLEAARPLVGQWHHCVYTYDGTTHRFFINGIETSKSAASTQHGTPDMLMFGNYPSGNQYYAGAMDEIRIYNRALDQDEIDYLFNDGK